jgi:hypothetical protein
MMKAIETHYKGYHFRSRLEARWAVFFDALGIKWEYEVEGYELKDGTKYLPDFYLPKFHSGMYCEVKPDGGDFSKAIKFARETESNLWLCEGMPETKPSIVYFYNMGEDGEWKSLCVPNCYKAHGENRMFTDYDPSFFDDSFFDESYIDAVTAAKSARFEFNNKDNT